jgi:hypothetical protein
MPKLNITHLPQRLKERLEKLERGEEVDKKDIKALLDDEQIERMEQAWSKQQALRKIHKPPKTSEEANKIGWKTIREVRIEIYKQALAEAEGGLLEGIRKLQADSETKAARIFMDAWSKALDEGKSSWSAQSAGNIALTRAGLRQGEVVASKRDKEVWDMEDALRKQFESEMSKEEKEQLEILKEHEKGLQKRKK